MSREWLRLAVVPVVVAAVLTFSPAAQATCVDNGDDTSDCTPTSTFPPESEPLVPPTSIDTYVPQPPPLACIADGVIHQSGTYDPDGTGTFNINGAPCTPIVPEETVPSARTTVPPGQLPATGSITDVSITLAMLFTIVGVLVYGTTYLPRLLNRRRR